MTDAPLPEDPRDALIREQAERLAAQDRQLAQAAVQAEQIAALEAMVAGSVGSVVIGRLMLSVRHIFDS